MMVDWCTLLIDSEKASCVSGMLLEPVRFAYQPYFFSERTIFFSHNKLANNTFQLVFQQSERGCCGWNLEMLIRMFLDSSVAFAVYKHR
jgi:hypothetical protein